MNGASEERFGSPGHRKPRPQKACEMEVIVRQRTDMEHLTVKSSVTRQNEEFRLSLFWGWRWGGELYFNEDRVSPWEEEESYGGDRWWWCLYNNGNVLKATDLCI